MQSDEKLSSHQSLEPNVAAMYALSGKQTAPAPGQKTVKRDDVAIWEVKVETVQYCTMSDSYGFEHQRAKQQEQDSPRNPKAAQRFGLKTSFTPRARFPGPTKLLGLTSSPRTPASQDNIRKHIRSWTSRWAATHGLPHHRAQLSFKATRITALGFYTSTAILILPPKNITADTTARGDELGQCIIQEFL